MRTPARCCAPKTETVSRGYHSLPPDAAELVVDLAVQGLALLTAAGSCRAAPAVDSLLLPACLPAHTYRTP